MKNVCLSSLMLSAVLADNTDYSYFLRRHRINDNDEAKQGAASTGDSQMEDLWENAIVAAKMDMEQERNLLLSEAFAMSMPTSAPSSSPKHPTTAPVTPPSSAPTTCLQDKTREEYILDLLSPITPENVLNDDSTPQGKAFAFLANDDPGLQDPCSSTTIAQRYGLVTFYYSMEGENWLEDEGWLGSNQECEWLGVECWENSTEIQTLELGKSSNGPRLLSTFL
eukprot:scaffold11783_cov120-Cylindrotheca_fusiformis.AAC.14